VEGFVDASALFAVSGHRDASHLVYLGLHALQHRGSVGVGLAVSDGTLLRYRRGVGLAQGALDSGMLAALPGPIAAGQVWGRHDPGTRIDADAVEGERMVFGRYRDGQLAVAVSGRFTNGTRLRRELKEAGAVFQTPSDAELLLHLIAQSGQKTFVNRLVDALFKVEGAYALLVMAEDRLVAVRDPSGFRPLVLGRLGEAVVVSTEDAAIRFVGGEAVRELAPGEMVILDGRQQQGVAPFPPADRLACVHEFVTLARPDAAVFGRPCHAARVALGERLAKEQPCRDADVVVGLPGSEAISIGYARAHGMPYGHGLLRAPYTARRLEEPPSGVRDFGTRVTWRPVPGVVERRSVCFVVPSLVTGRALRKAVRMLTEAGATGVHLRVASPQVRISCAYGVAGPTTDELLKTVHEGDPAAWLGVRTCGFLSLEALRTVPLGVGDEDAPGVCDACFSGTRPIEPEEGDDQLPLF